MPKHFSPFFSLWNLKRCEKADGIFRWAKKREIIKEPKRKMIIKNNMIKVAIHLIGFVSRALFSATVCLPKQSGFDEIWWEIWSINWKREKRRKKKKTDQINIFIVGCPLKALAHSFFYLDTKLNVIYINYGGGDSISLYLCVCVSLFLSVDWSVLPNCLIKNDDDDVKISMEFGLCYRSDRKGQKYSGCIFTSLFVVFILTLTCRYFVYSPGFQRNAHKLCAVNLDAQAHPTNIENQF